MSVTVAVADVLSDLSSTQSPPHNNNPNVTSLFVLQGGTVKHTKGHGGFT